MIFQGRGIHLNRRLTSILLKQNAPLHTVGIGRVLIICKIVSKEIQPREALVELALFSKIGACIEKKVGWLFIVR